MNPQTAQAILARAADLRDEQAAFLGELVSIPSPSGREERAIAHVRDRMRAIGFTGVRTDALGSLLGRIGSGPRLVAMDAHIDTVGPGNRDLWSSDPYGGEVRDGRVWGRGASDQKGGLAALVCAGRILRELAAESGEVAEVLRAGSLLVTATVMEEDCDGLCWEHLIREDGVRPEVVVLTEPTGCRVYRGQRGRMEIEVEVRGVSAHGSAPERGENAIYRMADLVQGIERLDARLPSDEFLGRGSVAVTEIRSAGPSLCAIPDLARIHLDRRLTWGETRETARREIEAIVAECSWAREPSAARVEIPRYEKPAYTGKVFPGEAVFPAWKIPADHAAVRAAARAYRALFGEAATDGDVMGAGKWTFSTNGVAICGRHGIPCIGFGPGHEGQAHAPDEFCAVDELVRASAFYAAFLIEYARG